MMQMPIPLDYETIETIHFYSASNSSCDPFDSTGTSVLSFYGN